MDRFAFLYHPYDIDILAHKGVKDEELAKKDRRLVERSLRWLPPTKFKSETVHSQTGVSVIGDMIMVPLICDQILHMEQEFVLDKTVKGARIAEQLGAQIIGLGAYLSPVGRRGALIAKEVSVPVTSGTTYTIATAVEATLKAATETGLDIRNSKVTIIGATGAIGRVMAFMIADKVKTLTLAARNGERLRSFKEELQDFHKNADIRYSDDLKESVKEADIVAISTNTPNEILSARDLPRGCVVCDISVPHNISHKDADLNDVLIIDGGLVQCPFKVDFEYLALPPNVAYACLSEVMILALEGKFECFSTGGDFSYEKVLEIERLADKHGFKLAQFKSFGVPVTQAQLEKICRAREKRNKTGYKNKEGTAQCGRYLQ